MSRVPNTQACGEELQGVSRLYQRAASGRPLHQWLISSRKNPRHAPPLILFPSPGLSAEGAKNFSG